MSNKPWFYKSDRYDDKFSYLLAWLLSLGWMFAWIASIALWNSRFFWTGCMIAFFQLMLVKSQVPPGERNYEEG